MTRKRLRQIIREEIVGRSIPSPIKNGSEQEKRAELVIDDFFTLTSGDIPRYVRERAAKYKLSSTTVNATISALNELFNEATLHSTLLRMQKLMRNNVPLTKKGPRNRGGAGGTW